MSIRVFIAWAAARGLDIHQMDVKTPFLNGVLEKDIDISVTTLGI